MTVSAAGERLIGRCLGRYRVSSSLGRGGMAEVFRATDEQLGREVAVKVVLPTYISDPQFLQRFLREAQVVASLEHPNILPIYDFGEQEGLPFLVMPLIDGGTMGDLLDGRSLEPSRVVAWVRDLAAALDAAHAAGVLHRDVKPGNVLVGRGEHLFLADFGIARLCDATRLTRTGTVVGTPVYMAPEVAGGKPAEAASDRYSLAVMTYELLAGKPPFDGENVLSILHQHATRPVPPITGRFDHLPAGIDRVLEQGLAKQPAGRPATCSAFAELLAGELPATADSTALSTVALPSPAPPPPVSDQVPTLAMTGEPTAAPAAPASSIPGSDAYATVHAPSGVFRQLRQWGLAGLVGGIVALAGFLGLRGMERQPAATAETVGQSRVAESSAAVEADVPAVTGSTASEQLESPPAEPAGDGPPVAQPPVTQPTVARPPVARSQEARPAAETSEPRADPAVSPQIPPAPSRSEPASGLDRMRFNALRSFSSRLTERDFRRVEEAARRMPDRGPAADQVVAMDAYAQGGLAYLGGDDTAAAAALQEALENQRFVGFWGPSPLMLLASSVADRDSSLPREAGAGSFEAWELALGYGDPRATAGATLDALLRRQPENARFRFARALVHRLDGEHGAVIRNAQPVFQKLGAKDAPEARSYLAQIIGDAYLGLDRGEESLEWFRRAFEAGGPFRGIAALRGAEAAREIRRPETMAEFLRLGCEADFQPACRRLQVTPRLPRNPPRPPREPS